VKSEDGNVIFKHKRGSAIMATAEDDKPVFEEEEATPPPPPPTAAPKSASTRDACAGCALRDAEREVWCRVCGAVSEVGGSGSGSNGSGGGGGDDDVPGGRARKGKVLRAGLEDEPWYFGNLDRKGLGDMLSDAPVGSFGIRISSQAGELLRLCVFSLALLERRQYPCCVIRLKLAKQALSGAVRAMRELTIRMQSPPPPPSPHTHTHTHT
jgi:hypothetical protein